MGARRVAERRYERVRSPFTPLPPFAYKEKETESELTMEADVN
jgi:hypothetical protein